MSGLVWGYVLLYSWGKTEDEVVWEEINKGGTACLRQVSECAGWSLVAMVDVVEDGVCVRGGGSGGWEFIMRFCHWNL
jgi:hypothetical protein